MVYAPKSLAMRRGEAMHEAWAELLTSGTWEVFTNPVLGDPPQTDELVDALSGAAYARRDAERTAALHWPQVTVTQIHDSITIERKPMSKPRVTDAQVRLNQDTQWLAADVVFVSVAQLDAGPPYTGQRYTYKAPPGVGFKEGLLAHVVANGSLRSVCIDKIRKPTAEDKLTAHAWLIVDGCYRTYAEAVKKDEERLASIVKAQADAQLEEDLRESLKRTAKPALAEAVDVTPAKLQLRVGGKYRDRDGALVAIVGPNRTGMYQDTHPFLADNGLTYTPEGLQDTLASYAADDAVTGRDLVEEVK